jgi:hypothetical protein
MPTRQKWFLLLMALLTAPTLLVGVWVFRLSGAVHELALGTFMLALVVLAAVWWSRLPREPDHIP